MRRTLVPHNFTHQKFVDKILIPVMKKIILLAVALLLSAGVFFGWKIFGSATNFKEDKKYLYISTGKASKDALLTVLKDSSFIKNIQLFETLGGRMNLWNRLRPGKY